MLFLWYEDPNGKYDADIKHQRRNQTPLETAKGFIEHALSLKQQSLHLVERRWPALLNWQKNPLYD